MRKSENPIVKITGYLLIGFFLLIIILSFGMPDIGLNCGGMDPGTIAVVNGKKIHTLDYLRYRDTKFAQFKNQKMDSFILDNYVMEILLLQEAENMGIQVTEDRISRYIKNSPDFKNPQTGQYDPKIFQMVLNSNRMNFDEFNRLITKDMAISDFRFLVSTGAAVPSEDIKAKYMADNSRLKIKFAHLTPEEIKKNFAKDISVTEEEIDQEIQNNNVEITDPETDRERIKTELMDKKLESIKESIASKVNDAVGNGASFNTAASILKGKVTTSETFKIGEKIKLKDNGSTANAIGNSKIFADTLMVMPINSSSPVITSKTGLYIFTPVERSLPVKTVNPEEEEKIKNNLAYASINMITRNLVKTLSEKSKVIKNLKTD
jgi:hypothetical protein